mgnify:CR=1 FL=1
MTAIENIELLKRQIDGFNRKTPRQLEGEELGVRTSRDEVRVLAFDTARLNLRAGRTVILRKINERIAQAERI